MGKLKYESKNGQKKLEVYRLLKEIHTISMSIVEQDKNDTKSLEIIKIAVDSLIDAYNIPSEKIN